MRHAILAHADYTGTPRDSHLDRALFACDELAGFLTACALVKPSRAIHDVEVAGVRKKMKDKAFARAVSRDDMTEGAALLNLPLEEHIANCIRFLQRRQPRWVCRVRLRSRNSPVACGQRRWQRFVWCCMWFNLAGTHKAGW